MKNKKIIVTAVILVVASGAAIVAMTRYPEKERAGAVVADASASSTPYFNDGTVIALSPGEMSVQMPDATVETYVVATSSRFSRIEKDSTALPGEPIVVIYSKHLGKPVTAFVSKPFESSDPADALEIFAGQLVSVEGGVVTISIDGEERGFAFEGKDPFSKVVDVKFSDMLVGESISAKYAEEGGKKVMLNGFLR